MNKLGSSHLEKIQEDVYSYTMSTETKQNSNLSKLIKFKINGRKYCVTDMANL